MDEIARKVAGSRVLGAVGEIERERRDAGNPLEYATVKGVSVRTGLTVPEVREVLEYLKGLGYVTTGRTLNDDWVKLRG